MCVVYEVCMCVREREREMSVVYEVCMCERERCVWCMRCVCV